MHPADMALALLRDLTYKAKPPAKLSPTTEEEYLLAEEMRLAQHRRDPWASFT